MVLLGEPDSIGPWASRSATDTAISRQVFRQMLKARTALRSSGGVGDWMHEQRLLTIGVECYAGHRGEQTPRTLILGDHRIAVAEVVDAWLAPDHRYFKLRGEDRNLYLVRHDERSDTWELTMFRAEHVGE
jgi:hypothetical protein